jgi:hypothetical protein
MIVEMRSFASIYELRYPSEEYQYTGMQIAEVCVMQVLEWVEM